MFKTRYEPLRILCCSCGIEHLNLLSSWSGVYFIFHDAVHGLTKKCCFMFACKGHKLFCSLCGVATKGVSTLTKVRGLTSLSNPLRERNETQSGFESSHGVFFERVSRYVVSSWWKYRLLLPACMSHRQIFNPFYMHQLKVGSCWAETRRSVETLWWETLVWTALWICGKRCCKNMRCTLYWISNESWVAGWKKPLNSVTEIKQKRKLMHH